MSNQLILLLIGIAVGGWVVWFWLAAGGKSRYQNPSFDRTEENRGKVREYLRGRDRISNNDVRELLGVSDPTATRYLDDLEKEGLIRQVGRSGPNVYYEKT